MRTREVGELTVSEHRATLAGMEQNDRCSFARDLVVEAHAIGGREASDGVDRESLLLRAVRESDARLSA